MVYDLLFFFIVIIIVLNLIFGVIIDTFADLRSEKQKKEEILKTTCFICGEAGVPPGGLSPSFLGLVAPGSPVSGQRLGDCSLIPELGGSEPCPSVESSREQGGASETLPLNSGSQMRKRAWPRSGAFLPPPTRMKGRSSPGPCGTRPLVKPFPRPRPWGPGICRVPTVLWQGRGCCFKRKRPQ